MNGVRFLIACALLAGASPAFAEERKPSPVIATPIGSPGDWLDPADYPALALRLEMAGATGFHLAVAADGKVGECTITESSKFDVLDRATCQRLSVNARFNPARDAAGRAIAGSYSGRVRWVVPNSGRSPRSESMLSMRFSIDETGKTTACRFSAAPREKSAEPVASPCPDAMIVPPDVAREFRLGIQKPIVEAELTAQTVFTALQRDKAAAAVVGYEQKILNVYRFTVGSDGKPGDCHFEEQRGPDRGVQDFCSSIQRDTFDPPFAAMGKDGIATGWHVMRLLVKTGP